jgi:hypothetical protein
MDGYSSLKRVCSQVTSLQHPEFITTTKLRKYMATTTQIANFGKQDLEQLARHMGHELSVHRKFYRLQDDVVTLAKVSKLLLAVEQGKASSLVGKKSLDDLDFEGMCLLYMN